MLPQRELPVQKDDISRREVSVRQKFERPARAPAAVHARSHLDDSPRRHVAMLAERRGGRGASDDEVALAGGSVVRLRAETPPRVRKADARPVKEGRVNDDLTARRRRCQPGPETLRGSG